MATEATAIPDVAYFDSGYACQCDRDLMVYNWQKANKATAELCYNMGEVDRPRKPTEGQTIQEEVGNSGRGKVKQI